jgi:hypothetical protein
MRDAIGAWLVCGVLAASLVLYPEVTGHSGSGKRAASAVARAAAPALPCAIGLLPLQKLHNRCSIFRTAANKPDHCPVSGRIEQSDAGETAWMSIALAKRRGGGISLAADY